MPETCGLMPMTRMMLFMVLLGFLGIGA